MKKLYVAGIISLLFSKYHPAIGVFADLYKSPRFFMEKRSICSPCMIQMRKPCF